MTTELETLRSDLDRLESNIAAKERLILAARLRGDSQRVAGLETSMHGAHAHIKWLRSMIARQERLESP